MSPDEYEFVQNVLAAANENPRKLNNWEQGFAEDFAGRVEKYGMDAHCSAKQWGVISKIAEKLEVFR